MKDKQTYDKYIELKMNYRLHLRLVSDMPDHFRHKSLDIFFWPEFEFLSNILSMVCMVNLSGMSLTSCVMRLGGSGANTCLLSSALPRSTAL